MEKSPEAFRTISEVAEWLDVPTHVLRFWESRFAQVKPVKRAGGRRYYRPADMRLIGGIKKLLHEEGMTIRGVQKLLREEGVKHVASFSQPLEHEDREADYAGVTVAGTAGSVETDAAQAREPVEALPEASEPESAPEAREEPDQAGPSEPPRTSAEEESEDEDISLPFLSRDAKPPEVAVLRSDEIPVDPDDVTAVPRDSEDAAESGPALSEDRADAEWSAEDEASGDAAAQEPGSEPAAASQPDSEPERPAAAVPSFGSVRGRLSAQDELPFDTPPAPARESGAAEAPPGAAEAAEPPGAPETTPVPPAESEDGDLEQDAEASTEEAADEEPQPILSDAPDTDPEDDDADHARPHGAVARLVLSDRSALRSDPIRIEQVVAALRAVRDRSAS